MTYAGSSRDIFTEGARSRSTTTPWLRSEDQQGLHPLPDLWAQNKHRIIDDHMVKRVVSGELS
jgi:hypothetical protein